MPRLLIVSPIPSEPRNQGNAVRIAILGETLQSAGWIVHFLYHKLEGLTPTQATAMARCWDYLHTMDGPPRKPHHPTSGPMALDDWYDPALSDFAASLHRRWGFDVVLVNYVWCSGVFNAFGSDVVKVLDTHDVFGGRDDHFRALGLAPAWYWTTPEEEERGLRRADIVLAIQEEEAALFRARGHPDVRTVGHLLPLRSRGLRVYAGDGPVAGYLASGNPLNISAFLQLRDAIRATRRGRWRGELVLAGVICDHIADPAPFAAIGPVAEADVFYDEVDMVLNPMPGGTGLKIKSVEAVHRGMPLIATQAAMAGLPVMHEAHRLRGPAEVARYLLHTPWSERRLADLQTTSLACAAAYAQLTRTAIAALLRDLHGEAR